ncbi:MAG: thioredoxin domain-containing protein [Kofleriaceae bacterium]
MAALPAIDLASFPSVAAAPGVTMLDFTAARCAPCRALAPILEALATEYAGRARIAQVDCDHEPALAERFGVRSMPTLVVLRDGREVGRVVGLRPRAFVAGVLDRALAGDVAITNP